MARFTRLHVLGSLIRDGLVPVFYHPDPEVAFQVGAACARGGCSSFEYTHRGDGAHRVFDELIPRLRESSPDLVLGVGSIVDPYTASLYLAAGANFVVGPVLNPEVAKLCNRRKVAYLPGCGSATEIQNAEELGCEIVKVFPGSSVGGPQFARSILGPCPWTSILPTGGVSPSRESLEAWFDAGVVAVGMGSNLIEPAHVDAGDWGAIEADVRRTLELVAEIRR